MEKLKRFFRENRNVSVLFILESLEYYVDSSKQFLLYKIFDMFQYCKTPFIFIATTPKTDIADSFEKRIKSRFSNKVVLLFEQQIEAFFESLTEMFDAIEAREETKEEQKKYVQLLKTVILSPESRDIIEGLYEKGK